MQPLSILTSLAVLCSPSFAQFEACQEAVLDIPATFPAYDVAVDGDTAAVAFGEFNVNGSVLVYRRSATGWALEDTIAGNSTSFGSWLDLDGDTLIVGQVPPTPAEIYERSGSSWSRVATLTDASNNPVTGCVAVDGDLAAVGVPGQQRVVVYERGGAGWVYAAERIAPHGFDYGVSVDVLASTIAVGDPSYADFFFPGDFGKIELLEFSAGSLSVQQEVRCSSSNPDARFGSVVSLDGEWMAGAASGINRVYVFKDGPSGWVEQQVLTEFGGEIGDSAALSGDLLLVGAPGKNLNGTGQNSGAAVLFVRDPATDLWVKDLLFGPAGLGPADQFGDRVDQDGRTAVVSSRFAGAGDGEAYAFGLHPEPTTYCTAGTSSSGCQALITASSSASATASSGFVVTATGVEGSVNAMVFFGQNGRQANPWGNGSSFQCVTPPVRRGGLVALTGTAGQCDGSFAQDLTALWCPGCPRPNLAPALGSPLQLQLWYRDPGSTSNLKASLSNAVEVGVCP